MIGQIGYLGKVSPKRAIGSAMCFAVGSTFGAALLGALLGATGRLIQWATGGEWVASSGWPLLVLGAIAILAGLRDTGLCWINLPACHKQLSRPWLIAFGPHLAGFLWGLLVGLGQRTRMPYLTYYFVAAWIVFDSNPLRGSALFALYGAVNGILLVVEVLVTSWQPERKAGLLGMDRAVVFFKAGGAALLAAGVCLLIVSGVAP